jgi:hypothetical protein
MGVKNASEETKLSKKKARKRRTEYESKNKLELITGRERRQKGKT